MQALVAAELFPRYYESLALGVLTDEKVAIAGHSDHQVSVAVWILDSRFQHFGCDGRQLQLDAAKLEVSANEGDHRLDALLTFEYAGVKLQ